MFRKHHIQYRSGCRGIQAEDVCLSTALLCAVERTAKELWVILREHQRRKGNCSIWELEESSFPRHAKQFTGGVCNENFLIYPMSISITDEVAHVHLPQACNSPHICHLLMVLVKSFMGPCHLSSYHGLI